ncbi:MULTISPECIES: carbohydrate ABC transporter permease [Amycolatopsis]|uniref:Sugar ABC transporter permease n=1 Tax=Amycolatopsis thermalba TaxID=944492 RepID=A0ABY4NTG0_9PSEU|nr:MULTISPECIES: sugar ABC transporter permease [Amycolatopsis]OXM66183.1 ABC transporter permease [Amycolatopsis sp. KNN50.9b]UQS23357.1 sugar ABC transporter permease [Amycolatopsis thermalba]
MTTVAEKPPRQDVPPEPARPTLRQRLSRWDVKFSPYLYIAPFFVVFGLTGLFPLLYTGYVSLFDWEIGDDDPKFIGLQNFVTLLGDPQFWNAVVNTISIFVLSSGPQLVIAVLLAALLSLRLRFPASWRVGILLPYSASLVALGIIFANLFGPRYGLVNAMLETFGLDRVEWQANRFASHLAIATMVNWRWTGYNALIVLAAMQALPRDVYEAAVVDGAGAVRRFFSITLPMLRPTLIFVVITSTIGGLQIFTEPKLFDAMPGSNNGGSQHQFQTLTLYLYQSAFESFDLGYASAIAWLLFLLIVLIALVNFLITRRLAATTGLKR